MTKSSSRRSMEVFDFAEEDELSELVSEKAMGKFKYPSSEDAIIKYEFLECVAQGTNGQTKEMDSVPCVNTDAIESDHSCDSANSYSPLAMVGDESASKEGESVLHAVPQSNPTSHKRHSHLEVDNPDLLNFVPEFEMPDSIPIESSPGNIQLNCALPESRFSGEPVDVTSDADKSMKESSPSNSTSDFAANDVSLYGCASDHCFRGWEMDENNMAVNIFPDFVVCRGTYYTDALISFTSSCIRINGSITYGNQGTFNFQWGIDDITDVECQWCGRVETAMVKLHVISKSADGTNEGISGIHELIFAIVDPNWPEEQEKIKSLDVRYKTIWNVVLDTDMEVDGYTLLGQNNIFSSKCYFPSFDKPFEDVIYPKEDSDPVSISKRDVDLLQPETFINDTIIDFYIKYLKNKIQPEERHRFHFFNSFFFRKLTDLEKDPFSASEGRAAFLRVRKWTRKVNLFEKDYVFIPVNFNLHWSLIVICHPGEVANFRDEDVEKALKVPCILHMDSIKGTHTGLKNHFQSYLWEEWKEKQNDTSEDISSKFLNLRFVQLELPQQENSFDCGLFLLHYVELFLEEAPEYFSPFRITKFSSFLNVDWFPPAEASLKRALIQLLIYDLLEIDSRKTSPADCGEEHQSSKFSDHNKKNETDVEVLSERYSPSKGCNKNSLCCSANQGIEMTLLATSSRSSQYVIDPGLVAREFFDAGATEASELDVQYQNFDQTASLYQFKGRMSSIEEDAETGEHFMYSPHGGSGSQPVAGIESQACSPPYSSRDLGGRTSWLLEMSMDAEVEDGSLSPETSICASDDSLDVEIMENSSVKEDEEPSQGENQDVRKSPLMDNVDCLTESLASESSVMPENTVNDFAKSNDTKVSEDPISFCQKNLLDSSHKNSDIEKSKDVTCTDLWKIDDDLVEADEQASKRLRLTLPLEEKRIMRSVSKDLPL